MSTQNEHQQLDVNSIFRIGDNIQRALDKKDKTQAWLAKEMNKILLEEEGFEKDYMRGHVNKWCNNRNIPSTKNMERIAGILDYTVEELVTGRFHDELRKQRDEILTDPTVRSEIESIKDMVKIACEKNNQTKKEVERYKKLIEGKIENIIDYISL